MHVNDVKNRTSFRGVSQEDAEIAEFIFHAGYREIFNKLIHIFKKSGFSFTLHQQQLISSICQSISTFRGDPYTEEFEELKLKFLVLMDSIRLKHPMREDIKTSTTTMTDPNWPVTRVVDFINNGLLGLSRTTSDYFRSFKVDNMEPPDLSQPWHATSKGSTLRVTHSHNPGHTMSPLIALGAPSPAPNLGGVKSSSRL